MYSRRTKRGVFVLEGLNTFATTYYLYYLFFYMQAKFGFGRLENLALASLNGFVYLFAAIYGGRFAQKRGYFRALRFGFSTMAFALIAGSTIESSIGQLCVMVVATMVPASLGQSGGSPARGTHRRIAAHGRHYNLVRAGGGALATSPGAMLDKWGCEACSGAGRNQSYPACIAVLIEKQAAGRRIFPDTVKECLRLGR
jgi:predicted MFS family arabinose efflux permease